MDPETQPTEAQEEEPIVDPPAVEAVTVPSRVKRPMSDDALARLALAREKALLVRQTKAREKLLEKAAALPSSVPPDPNKKKKKREPPQVVIEASDSDSDEYESPQIVVVKKKRAPKKMKEEKENVAPSVSREVEQPKKQEPSLEELIARTFVRI